MSEGWIVLIAAAIGALAVVVGQWLGSFTQSRRAHQEWLRDKRSGAFESYFGVLQQAERHVREISNDLRMEGTMPSAPAEAIGLTTELWETAAGLELYGSSRVSQTALAAAGSYQACVLATEYPEKVDRMERFRDEFVSDAAEARTAVRSELGIG